MPLIEPVSNLSIKRSVNLYTIILFISFGVLLYWLATDRYQTFADSHESAARTTTKIIAFQIDKILKEQRREIGLFTEDSGDLLSILAKRPNDIKTKQKLAARLKKHQPDFQSFKILPSSETPHKEKPTRLHNRDNDNYHYDIGSNFSTKNTSHIFLVSFNTDEITDLLNSAQTEKHNLVLINTDPNKSVGITSSGDIKDIDGVMDFKIHNGINLITLAKKKIKKTRWYVVDMSDVDLFNDYRSKIMTEYFIAFYIFAMIALFMRYILLKQDAKRSLAEEQLKQNHEQIKSLNNSLDQLSKKDGLTNLYNRRYFDEMAQHEWSRGIRTQNPLSCILLDIDHFKNYNDHYGHQAGDKCIRDISDLLKKSFRRSGDIVARYGGEEFIILMSDSSEEEAKVAIIKFQLALKRLKILHKTSETDKHVTTSAGVIVQAPSANSSIEKFVKNADQALYKAKAAGRDQWVLHKEDKKSRWTNKI